MNLKEFILNEYLSDNNVTYFDGKSYFTNSEATIFKSVFNCFLNVLTGFKAPLIELRDNWNDKDVVKFEYHVNSIDEKFQYNRFSVDKDYKLYKVDGDGSKIIYKLFDFIEYCDVDSLLMWISLSRLIRTISCYWRFDDKKGRTGYWQSVKFDEKTRDKFVKLDEIHGKLMSLKNDEISILLNELYDCWANNFNDSDGKYYGTFLNYNIPCVKLKDIKKVIEFPKNSRISVCNNFLVTDDMREILSKNEGDVIVLKNRRKNAVGKKYRILEHNSDDMTALKNLKNGKIEFITFLSRAENSYDDLFMCNRYDAKSWFNKKYDLVE